MGIFGKTSQKNISDDDFGNVRNALYAKGFDKDDIRFLEVVFRSDLFEDERLQKGIDKKEIEEALRFLKNHPHHHKFSNTKLSELEEVLLKTLDT